MRTHDEDERYIVVGALPVPGFGFVTSSHMDGPAGVRGVGVVLCMYVLGREQRLETQTNTCFCSFANQSERHLSAGLGLSCACSMLAVGSAAFIAGSQA